MARVPIAEERLSVDGDGLVVLELKRVFRDGTTHVLSEPEDVIARLAAAVPRPGAHLVRDHGLFAPRAPPPPPHRHAPQRADRAARQRAGPQSDRTAPMSWMARLRCGWVIDLSRCPQCGGDIRVIATVTEPAVNSRVLEHLRRRLQAREPRGPSTLAA